MKKDTKIVTIIIIVLVVFLTSIDILTKGKITGVLGLVNPMDLKSSDIPYTNNSQSTVQGAIDELYTRANTWINPNNNFGTPQYYAFGTYKGWCSDTNCNSYSDFPTTSTSAPSGRNAYVAKYADGGYGVCINRNGTPHCFRGRNWIAEAQHIQKVFSGANDSCNVYSPGVVCNASDFSCNVGSSGSVVCSYLGTSANYCYVDNNGSVGCAQ